MKYHQQFQVHVSFLVVMKLIVVWHDTNCEAGAVYGKEVVTSGGRFWL